MASSSKEIQDFFEHLETSLENEIEPHYFDLPRRFRYLIEVIEVLGQQIEHTNIGGDDAKLSLHDQNPAYKELLEKEAFCTKVLEDIVKFQHGSLNNSVETVGDVLKAYSESKKEVSELRDSVGEIKKVLISRKTGQADLKNLWLTKTEMAESLRMINSIEMLKDAPMQVQHLTNQHRYLAAVNTLNTSVHDMFHVDLVGIEALESTREELMNLKENLLEGIAEELKDCVTGAREWRIGGGSGGNRGVSIRGGTQIRRGSAGTVGGSRYDDDAGTESVYESEAGMSDHRSEAGGAGRSVFAGSQRDTDAPPSTGRGGKTGTDAVDGVTSMHVWSFDLGEATDTLEASLPDPKSTGSLYIRLLVQAVGCLNCEDDTERMLFEGASEQFRSSIRQLKAQHRQASELEGLSGDIQSGRVGTGGRSPNEGQADGNERSALGSGRGNEGLNYQKHIVEFTSFVREMLDRALTMLRMVLYVIRLLHMSKSGLCSPSGDPATTANASTAIASSSSAGGGVGGRRGTRGPSSAAPVGIGFQQSSQQGAPPAVQLKDNIKRAVLRLWEDTQQTIIGELCRHFVEQDVEDMSDVVVPKPGDRPLRDTASHRTSLGEDGHASLEDQLTVCPPSTRLAAPVYKDIAAFADRVSRVFKEEVDASLDYMVINKVHIAVQKTLEDELMPLIQSEVNAEMRDLQMDPLLFAPPSALASQPVEGEELDVCEAAKRVAALVQPLYFHWAELPRHKDQVLTIIDRIVRGFVATAREELEALTWKLISGQAVHKRAVLTSLRQDPLLAAYRLQIYDGASSVQEIFEFISQQHAIHGHSSPLPIAGGSATVASSSSQSLRRLATEDSIGSIDSAASYMNFAKEFETWGELWDIRNASVFKDSQDKIATDFSKLATIASIAHSCDWLVKLICRLCKAALKKLNISGGTGPASTSRRTLSSAVTVNLDDVHSSQQLFSTIQGCAQSLEKLAEECISVLRGEMQVVSFYFLRQLVTLQLSGGKTSAGGGAKGGTGGIKSTMSFSPATSAPHHAKGQMAMVDGDSNTVTVLNHHLMSIQDAIASVAYPGLSAVVLSPLCELVPSFFLRSIMLYSPMEHTNIEDSTRLLKSVVACQQNLCMLLEASCLEPSTDRSLQDRVTEEFDRLRKFVALLHMRPIPEFQEYLRQHPDEFSTKEYTYAWGYLRYRNETHRLPPFDELQRQQLQQASTVNTGADMATVREKERDRDGRAVSPVGDVGRGGKPSVTGRRMSATATGSGNGRK